MPVLELSHASLTLSTKKSVPWKGKVKQVAMYEKSEEEEDEHNIEVQDKWQATIHTVSWTRLRQDCRGLAMASECTNVS